MHLRSPDAIAVAALDKAPGLDPDRSKFMTRGLLPRSAVSRCFATLVKC